MNDVFSDIVGDEPKVPVGFFDTTEEFFGSMNNNFILKLQLIGLKLMKLEDFDFDNLQWWFISFYQEDNEFFVKILLEKDMVYLDYVLKNDKTVYNMIKNMKAPNCRKLLDEYIDNYYHNL